MSNQESNNFYYSQSAVNGVQAGENLTIGDINQIINNSSNDSYNPLAVIHSEYKKKITKLERSCNNRSQSNQKIVQRDLQNYYMTVRRHIEKLQERIEEEEDKDDIQEENDEDTPPSVEKKSNPSSGWKDLGTFALLGAAIWILPKYQREEKEPELDIEELKADMSELKPLIHSTKDFLCKGDFELDIDEVLNDESLSNLSYMATNYIESIKDNYKAQQKELEDYYRQEYEKLRIEKDTKIYGHMLKKNLDKDGYPLSLDSINELKYWLEQLMVTEEDVEKIEEQVIKPFCLKNLELYEQAYQDKLYQEKFPLVANSVDELISLKDKLGLSTFNFLRLEVSEIEKNISKRLYQENIQKYKQLYKQKLEQDGFPLNPTTISELNRFEKTLGLDTLKIQDCPETISIKEQLIKPFYEINLQSYCNNYKLKLYHYGLGLVESYNHELEQLRNNLGLNHKHLNNLGLHNKFTLETDLLTAEKTAKESFYTEALQSYGQKFRREIENNSFLVEQSNKIKESLQTLGIRNEDLTVIEGLSKNNWGIEHLFDQCDSETSYWKLINLLAECEWQKADILTRNLLLELADRNSEGFLDKKAVEKISVKDIYTLDQLWVEYSKGHFGFSIQKRLFEGVNQKKQSFGEAVGWSRSEERGKG
ncbi:MAG: GUN4 domain-containing protein, partial [Symploca sp. SIO1B1]|nr:GUN4 domain-containing protein [Symploca sp. SIO1B1]